MSKYYFGLDLSLASTGAVLVDAKGSIKGSKVIKTTPHEFKTFGLRVQHIKTEIELLLVRYSYEDVLVIVEGLSHNSKSKYKHRIQGSFYWITLELALQGYRLLDPIAPATLKKWTTGYGRADKDQMISSIEKRWGIVFTSDDLADAYALAMIGIERGVNTVSQTFFN